MNDEPTVLFVCRHGAAKSVLAAATLRHLAAEHGLRIVVDSELPVAPIDLERWDDVPPVGDAPERARAVITRHLEDLVARESRSTPEG